jgi:hypothetical protein
MPPAKTQPQGKTSFVKEYLIDHPLANPREVNEAWKAAGMEGTLSETLVNKQRSAMGLSGNIRAKSAKKRSKKRAASTSSPTQPRQKSGALEVRAREAMRTPKRGRPTARTSRLVEIEADLDRLLYKVMDAGHLADVEDALRLARRRLYGAFQKNGR